MIKMRSRSARQPPAFLLSCVGVLRDLPMLPHFLRHYLELGVRPERMHIILNAPAPDCQEIEDAAQVLEQHGVKPADLWIAPYTSEAMWNRRRALQLRIASPGDWVLNADVDELHEYPDELGNVLGYCDAKAINCVQGPFIDRLAPNGALAGIVPDRPIWEQFPVAADLICTIRGGAGEPGYLYGTVKMMASRGNVLPGRGGHFPIGAPPPLYLYGANLAQIPFLDRPAVRFAVPTRVHHFKWVASLLPELKERLSQADVSPFARTYGGLLLDYFEANGRVRVEDLPIAPATAPRRRSWRRLSAAMRLLGRPIDLLHGGLSRSKKHRE